MNDLIQTIQILSKEEVSDLNKYVDSLEFKTLFLGKIAVMEKLIQT